MVRRKIRREVKVAPRWSPRKERLASILSMREEGAIASPVPRVRYIEVPYGRENSRLPVRCIRSYSSPHSILQLRRRSRRSFAGAYFTSGTLYCLGKLSILFDVNIANEL